jgi:hypothetical protein
MELARQTHNVLLAVLAELFRLYFLAWNKKEPIVFSISSMRLKREVVSKALKDLETAGWISVKRYSNKAARITILGGFRFE